MAGSSDFLAASRRPTRADTPAIVCVFSGKEGGACENCRRTRQGVSLFLDASLQAKCQRLYIYLYIFLPLFFWHLPSYFFISGNRTLQLSSAPPSNDLRCYSALHFNASLPLTFDSNHAQILPGIEHRPPPRTFVQDTSFKRPIVFKQPPSSFLSIPSTLEVDPLCSHFRPRRT